MPYEMYKVLHVLGILFVSCAVIGLAFFAHRREGELDKSVRRILAIVHGTALILILVAGFGLLARLGIIRGGFPAWVWGKLVIWLAFGAAFAFARRGPNAARLLLFGLPVLGGLAAWLAIYKPG